MLDDELRDHFAGIQVSTDDERRMRGRIQAGIRGRRPSRGRRALAVAATAAAVLAVAIALAVTTSGGDPQPAGPAVSGVRATKSLTTPPTTSAAAKPPRAMSWQRAAETVSQMLPGWSVKTRSGRTVTNQTLVELQIDDGHGLAQVDLVLTYPVDPSVANGPGSPGYGLPVGCKQDTESAYPDGSCTVLDDSTQLQTSKGYEYPADPGRGSKEWLVYALRPNGMEVDISEWNAPTSKGSASTRAEPPLSIAEMTTIAISDWWTR